MFGEFSVHAWRYCQGWNQELNLYQFMEGQTHFGMSCQEMQKWVWATMTEIGSSSFNFTHYPRACTTSRKRLLNFVCQTIKKS